MTSTDTGARASAPCRRNPAPPPLEPLFRRWQRDGDEAAREALVRQFLPLAGKLARRYAQSSEPYEDLVQVASLALMKAIDRFDPDRGLSFAGFAVPTILGELRRYFRDGTWSVHVARGAQERALAVSEATDRLTDLHGRTPTANQLAGAFCERLRREVGTAHARQIERAYLLVTGRPPTEKEKSLALGFLEKQSLSEFALAMFNLNSFLYVDSYRTGLQPSVYGKSQT